MAFNKLAVGSAVAAVTASALTPAMAAVAAIDFDDAVTYLETNAGGGIIAIGGVILTLAGAAVAIKWVKATFFG